MRRRDLLFSLCSGPGLCRAAQEPSSRDLKRVSSRTEPAAAPRAEAHSGRRVALLAGNAAYTTSPLKNPVNDVVDLKSRLEKLQFQATAIRDSAAPELEHALSRFASALRPGDLALFHYSGHGVQLDSENYIVPVDFAGATEAAVKKTCLPFSHVKRLMESSPARAVILCMDACRNNPFSNKPEIRGLAPLEAGLGSYIAFAASPGRTADDNPAGRNGLFTQYLLQGLDQPMTVSQMFRWVRQQVFDVSGRKQVAWLHDQLIEDLALQSGGAGSDAGTANAAVTELLDKGRLAYHQNRCADAFDFFDRASRQDAANAFAHHAAGSALVCLGRYAQAAERFRLAIQIRNEFAAPYMSRGILFAQTGQYDLAVQDFTWAIENEPQNAVAYWRRGRALFSLRRYEDAADDFTQSIALNDTDPNPWLGRGQVNFRLGQFSDALRDCDAALLRSASFGEAYYQRALVRARLGDGPGADADRRRAAQLGFPLH